MKVNPLFFGLVVVVIFLGTIGGAKAAGLWTVSGKLDTSGEKVNLTGANPDDIKGWMTLAEVSDAFGVPVQEILANFEMPASTPASKQIKEMETELFSPTNLREWLKERLTQP